MGYAGGTTADPVYANTGDHSETVLIDFDPAIITYEELLEVFWSAHDPTAAPWTRQYMSIIFYYNEDQKNIALASKQKQSESLGREIATEVVAAGEFYPAEDYHQKYFLRREPDLFNEFKAIYPNYSQLVQSTAAARVNGYLGGNGTLADLGRNLDFLGLSDQGQFKLLDIGCQLLPGGS